jgi:hypothetical protein
MGICLFFFNAVLFCGMVDVHLRFRMFTGVLSVSECLRYHISWLGLHHSIHGTHGSGEASCGHSCIPTFVLTMLLGILRRCLQGVSDPRTVGARGRIRIGVIWSVRCFQLLTIAHHTFDNISAHNGRNRMFWG